MNPSMATMMAVIWKTYLWHKRAGWPAAQRLRSQTRQRISSCSTWRASSAWRSSWRMCFWVRAGVVGSRRYRRSRDNLVKSCWTEECSQMVSWKESAYKHKEKRKITQHSSTPFNQQKKNLSYLISRLNILKFVNMPTALINLIKIFFNELNDYKKPV